MKVRNRDFHIHKSFSLIVQSTAGAGGPNTTDNSQLASNFAGLVLLDDNAHVEHVQSPVTPIGVKKESRPLNLKTEIEGALRFTEQLDRNKATSVDQGGGGEDAPGEVKSMNTEVTSAISDLNKPRLTAPGLYCISPCWCNYRCFSDGQRGHQQDRA